MLTSRRQRCCNESMAYAAVGLAFLKVSGLLLLPSFAFRFVYTIGKPSVTVE